MAPPESVAQPNERVARWISFGSFALALSLYVYQLTVPSMPAYYDSGVYVAGATALVHGILPYHDFTFVNPPGILYLLAPIAAVGRILGVHFVLVCGRWLSVLVTASVAGIASWMLRGRGTIAMLFAGALTAALPIVDTVSSAVKLDAFCVALSLIGAELVLPYLSANSSASDLGRRRAVASGALFGLAGAIKLWAIFPFLALVLCVIVWRRARAVNVVLGAGAGFLVLVLPFFIVDPGAFVHQVFADQLSQPSLAATSPGALLRLMEISGFVWTSFAYTTSSVVLWISILLTLVACSIVVDPRLEPVELFFLLSAGAVTAGLLAAPAWDLYYAYFASPFLIGVVAMALARLWRVFRRLVLVGRVSRDMVHFTRAILGLLSVVLVAATANSNVEFFQYFSSTGFAPSQLAVIPRVIPRSACVVYTYVFEGVETNRLSLGRRGCPDVVDSYGIFQSAGMNTAHPSSAVVREWKSYLTDAQFVVFDAPDTLYVPWTPRLLSWFHKNYRLVYAETGVNIYHHRPRS